MAMMAFVTVIIFVFILLVSGVNCGYSQKCTDYLFSVLCLLAELLSIEI